MKSLLICLVGAATLFVTGCEASGGDQAKAEEISELQENIEKKEAIISELEKKLEDEEVVAEEPELVEEVSANTERTHEELKAEIFFQLEQAYGTVDIEKGTDNEFTVVANGLWLDDIEWASWQNEPQEWLHEIQEGFRQHVANLHETLGAGYNLTMFDWNGDELMRGESGKITFDAYLDAKESWAKHVMQREEMVQEATDLNDTGVETIEELRLWFGNSFSMTLDNVITIFGSEGEIISREPDSDRQGYRETRQFIDHDGSLVSVIFGEWEDFHEILFLGFN